MGLSTISQTQDADSDHLRSDVDGSEMAPNLKVSKLFIEPYPSLLAAEPRIVVSYDQKHRQKNRTTYTGSHGVSTQYR